MAEFDDDSHTGMQSMFVKLLCKWEAEDPQHRKVFVEAKPARSRRLMPDFTIKYRTNKKKGWENLCIAEVTYVSPENYSKAYIAYQKRTKTKKYAGFGLEMIHLYDPSQGDYLIQQVSRILNEATSRKTIRRLIAA